MIIQSQAVKAMGICFILEIFTIQSGNGVTDLLSNKQSLFSVINILRNATIFRSTHSYSGDHLNINWRLCYVIFFIYLFFFFWGGGNNAAQGYKHRDLKQ